MGGDRIEKVQLAFLDQHHRQGGGHQLARRPGLEDGLGRHGVAGGRRRPVSAPPLDIGGDCFCGAWGDYDGDRFPDLYVSNLGAHNRLYRNNGDGTFTDVSRASGVYSEKGKGLGIVCGLQPALRAMRLRIVDGLRRA